MAPLDNNVQDSSSGLRIVVCGAGIGGLSAALALHAAGFRNICVVERRAEAEKAETDWAGAGINLQPHAIRVLHNLKLAEEVVGSGHAPRSQNYYTSSGELVSSKPCGISACPSGFPQVSICRSDLHRILRQAVVHRLGPDTLIEGRKTTGYEKMNGGVKLDLEDAFTRNPCQPIFGDVVIGADGINSRVRQCMHHALAEGPPANSGITLFRGITRSPRMLDGATMVVAGDDMHKLVCYPVKELSSDSEDDMQLMNFVVCVPEELGDHRFTSRKSQPAVPVTADEVLDRLHSGTNGKFNLPFLDHERMVQSAKSLQAWPMQDRDPLDKWVDGSVVLLGDAAHPMYPVGSNGASTALLDAEELASSLASIAGATYFGASHSAIEQALMMYQESRIGKTTELQLACRRREAEKAMRKASLSHKDMLEANEDIIRALANAQKDSSKLRGGCTEDDEASEAAAPEKGLVQRYASKALLSNFLPFERVILTANGTLQQVVASFFNADVCVVPKYTTPRLGSEGKSVFDREVDLLLKSSGRDWEQFAVCRSIVTVHDDEIRKELEEQKIGLGQIFRDYNIRPTFQLLSAGRGTFPGTDGVPCLTRQYELSCDLITCIIHEQITLRGLDMAMLGEGAGDSSSYSEKASHSIGNVVAAATLQDKVSSQTQRVKQGYQKGTAMSMMRANYTSLHHPRRTMQHHPRSNLPSMAMRRGQQLRTNLRSTRAPLANAYLSNSLITRTFCC